VWQWIKGVGGAPFERRYASSLGESDPSAMAEALLSAIPYH